MLRGRVLLQSEYPEQWLYGVIILNFLKIAWTGEGREGSISVTYSHIFNTTCPNCHASPPKPEARSWQLQPKLQGIHVRGGSAPVEPTTRMAGLEALIIALLK